MQAPAYLVDEMLASADKFGSWSWGWQKMNEQSLSNVYYALCKIQFSLLRTNSDYSLLELSLETAQKEVFERLVTSIPVPSLATLATTLHCLLLRYESHGRIPTALWGRWEEALVGVLHRGAEEMGQRSREVSSLLHCLAKLKAPLQNDLKGALSLFLLRAPAFLWEGMTEQELGNSIISLSGLRLLPPISDSACLSLRNNLFAAVGYKGVQADVKERLRPPALLSILTAWGREGVGEGGALEWATLPSSTRASLLQAMQRVVAEGEEEAGEGELRLLGGVVVSLGKLGFPAPILADPSLHSSSPSSPLLLRMLRRMKYAVVRLLDRGVLSPKGAKGFVTGLAGLARILHRGEACGENFAEWENVLQDFLSPLPRLLPYLSGDDLSSVWWALSRLPRPSPLSDYEEDRTLSLSRASLTTESLAHFTVPHIGSMSYEGFIWWVWSLATLKLPHALLPARLSSALLQRCERELGGDGQQSSEAFTGIERVADQLRGVLLWSLMTLRVPLNDLSESSRTALLGSLYAAPFRDDGDIAAEDLS